MAITLEAIRAAGGIVHSDGNIFFRDISMLQGLAGAAPAAVAPRGEYPHEQMDAMALDRYKVVPSNASMLWSHAVVAGDGTQQLYVGREVECQNMVRKFAGAFLDGAFAFHSMAAAPTAQAAPALEAPAAPAGALQREAEELATILRSLAPEGCVPEGVDIYAPDFAPSDGDVFVQRAAELLVELAAAPQAPAEAQEPAANLHDDGYWTPTKTEAGRALNERLMRAGSPRIPVYTHPAPQQAAPQAPAAPSGTDEVECVCGASWERHGHCNYEMVHTPRKAAPAAPSALAAQVIENLLQLARIVNTAVEDWGETKEDDSMEVIFHKEQADRLEEILDFFDTLPDAPPEEGVILSGPSRAARVLRAMEAPAAPVGLPAQGDPAALLQLADVLESGRSLIHTERKEAADALRQQAAAATAAPAAPAVDASDTARMDWLENQVVNVRAPLRYGSRDLFWASPEEVDGGPDGPSDLRARIDAAQTAAKGTGDAA